MDYLNEMRYIDPRFIFDIDRSNRAHGSALIDERVIEAGSY